MLREAHSWSSLCIGGVLMSVTTVFPTQMVASEPYRVDLGIRRDHFDAIRSDEQQVDLSVGRRLPGPWTPVLSLSLQNRYERNDAQGQAWLYSPGFGPAYAWAMVGGTPDADFLAKSLAEIGSEGEWATGTAVTGRVRWLDYGNEQIYLLWAQGRQHIAGPVSVEFGHVWALSDSNPTVGSWLTAVRGDGLGPVSLRAYATLGEENNPPLPISQVLIIGAQLRWSYREHCELRLEVDWEDRENYYHRSGVSVGGTWRF
jgi:YaiO family outer membrane protein